MWNLRLATWFLARSGAREGIDEGAEARQPRTRARRRRAHSRNFGLDFDETFLDIGGRRMSISQGAPRSRAGVLEQSLGLEEIVQVCLVVHVDGLGVVPATHETSAVI